MHYVLLVIKWFFARFQLLQYCSESWGMEAEGFRRAPMIIDLPKNTTKHTKTPQKTNCILHKHLNKHRINEQMWNLCLYVYLFIINQKYWRVNQRAITQLVIYSSNWTSSVRCTTVEIIDCLVWTTNVASGKTSFVPRHQRIKINTSKRH
jgi:hypothetical protein